MRTWIVLLALSFLPLIAIAQDDAQTAADSLVRNDDRLFEDLTNADSLYRELEDAPRPGHLPSSRTPRFTLRLQPGDLIGYHDRHEMVSYDRADGLFIGVGADSPVRFFLERRTQGYLGFGYGFGSHYWQVIGGIKIDLLDKEAPLRISAEGHVITDTRDSWKMNVVENTLAALIAGVDTRDYFKRNGFLVGIEQFFTMRTSISAEFRRDNYISSRREVGWSLFGPKQPFREVPAVREGWMNSVAVGITADYMTFRSWGDPQLGLQTESEFGFGDYRFQHHAVDARLKVTLNEGTLWFALHGRIGSATGDAPPQRLFTIGGFGTLPGYPQNAYVGNRMMLIQSDLLFAPFSGLLKDFRIILSNDFGTVATTGTTSGLFGGFPDGVSKWMYSPGIYVGSPAAAFRIGAAWRTDVYATPTFVMRLGQPF
jgi:hypothetical protein